MTSPQMEQHLSVLASYMESAVLTPGGRQKLVKSQLRFILRSLRDESAQDRTVILEYLTLLGFSDLIVEYR